VSGQGVSISFGEAAAQLDATDVDRLMRSLRQSHSPQADAVADELGARSLVGGRLELLLSEDELDALISALFRLRGLAGRLQPLTELLTIARAERRLRVSR
jgi:hypothetical protein